MDVCERMKGKVMLQFMLATAWEMELMGHRAESIHLDQESWSEVGELKETFLAMVGLVRIGSMEELGGHVIVRVGKEVEIKKPISVVLL